MLASPSFLAPCRLTNDRIPLGRSFDLTRKEFPEKRFDVALDKACLDSIVCGFNGAWMADLYLQQMDRCNLIALNAEPNQDHKTYTVLLLKTCLRKNFSRREVFF